MVFPPFLKNIDIYRRISKVRQRQLNIRIRLAAWKQSELLQKDHKIFYFVFLCSFALPHNILFIQKSSHYYQWMNLLIPNPNFAMSHQARNHFYPRSNNQGAQGTNKRSKTISKMMSKASHRLQIRNFFPIDFPFIYISRISTKNLGNSIIIEPPVAAFHF